MLTRTFVSPIASRVAPHGSWRAVAAPLVRGLSAEASASPLQLEMKDGGVAVVRIDMPGEKMNTLNVKMMPAMDELLNKIESSPEIKAVVLISGKPDNFIAGADITMLDAATTAEELEAIARNGQIMMDRIANCKTPIVAAINGACLGGGLEVALACHYRIASSHPKTVLGVPEVMLGLLPGAGGTQRLPKVVGIQEALTMATTGKNIRPAKAKKTGLVDSVADPHALEHAAILAATEMAAGKLKHKPKQKNLMNRLLEDNPVGRSVVFKKAGEMIAKKAGPHYPSPMAILECIRTGVEKGHTAGSAIEAKRFGELGMTGVSENLRSIFFATTALKKNPYGKPSKDVKTVAVLGAGLMGAGIATVTANAGYRVVLKDKDIGGLSRGEKQIQTALQPKVKRRAMTQFDLDKRLSNIVGLTDDSPNWEKHFAKTDLVVEAVFEDLALKHRVIEQFEPLLPEHAVIATNTSALPIRDVAKGAKRPQNIVGMHYFSPVDKMPLLEVIPHEGTADEVAAAAVAVGLKQGKTVICVKDVPGFYVNRCLGPFMTESQALLQCGVEPEAMDKALTKFGMPVGPITLADEVGIDVAAHVQEFLSSADLGNRMDGATAEGMQAFVAAGLLGRKSGKGFFTYPTGKGAKKALNPEAMEILKKYQTSDAGKGMDADTIVERMMLRFINEAAYCLQDGVISSARDGDIGAVFGIGFPPFLGGPFRYADSIGVQTVTDKMNRYADELGPQFAPAQILVDMAAAGKKFHPSE